MFSLRTATDVSMRQQRRCYLKHALSINTHYSEDMHLESQTISRLGQLRLQMIDSWVLYNLPFVALTIGDQWNDNLTII